MPCERLGAAVTANVPQDTKKVSELEIGELYRYHGTMFDAYATTDGFPYTATPTKTLMRLNVVMYLGAREDRLYPWSGFLNLTSNVTQWVQTGWLRDAKFEKIS